MSAKSFIFLALWLVFNLVMYEIFGQNFGLIYGTIAAVGIILLAITAPPQSAFKRGLRRLRR